MRSLRRDLSWTADGSERRTPEGKRRGRQGWLAIIALVIAMLPPMALVTHVYAMNDVGDLWVWGNSTGYDTTGTLAAQVIGNQPPNDPSEAMTQTVNSTVAKSYGGTSTSCGTSRGCFKIYTQPTQDSNAYALGAGTYDVNVVNIGYSNHTTWLNPSGDCESSRVPSPVTKVGDVTIGTAGKIIAAHDASGYSLTVISGIAGEFQFPTTFVANTTPQEAGVCVSDPNAVNGNQAPITIVGGGGGVGVGGAPTSVSDLGVIVWKVFTHV